jgi:hypothetical protein
MRFAVLLRIICLFCLVGVAIAGLSWWNTDKILRPVWKELVLPTGETQSLAFKPNQEIAKRHYDIGLYFENAQNPFLDCETVKLLGIRWSITPSNVVQSWNDLSNTDYLCRFQNNFTVVSFAAPSFKPHTNQIFYLSRLNNIPSKGKIKVYAALQHEDSLETHYLFMDKALAELLGGGLLLVSLSCFVIDVFTICSSRVKHSRIKQLME